MLQAGKRIMEKLEAGKAAPDFSAADQNGKTHSQAGYQGRKLFVFFYPKANTSG